MKTKAIQQNRFLRIITTPFRALCKARDFYVKSMMDCANRNIIGLQGTSQAPGVPRSFSVSSARSNDDEDFRELVRAASARSIGSRGGLRGRPAGHAPRSISVAMGRIDEDRPCCYFGEHINGNNVVNVKNELKYPRSKSHAVARTAS
ncbi:hypothetical protein Pfo_016799 [Paulownia fortunei]|nr:hypothetical protein Pfo_016799 [Paulownia fortunei]